MAQGDSLKKFKSEQKEQTRQKLKKIIEELQSSREKISVAKVATLSGISKANIYANYKDLFAKTAPIENRNDGVEQRQTLKERDETIRLLREENRRLKDANNKLMDELVAMNMLFQDSEKAL